MNRPTRPVVASRAVFAALALALLAGCDAAEGPPPLAPAPPTVAELALAPAAASVDTLAAEDGGRRVPLSLSLRATPGDAPLAQVRYAVQWQFACQPGALEDSGSMDAAGDGRYVATPDVVVPPGRRGTYRVTAWAVDASGVPSNEAATTFTLGGTNLGPPVIAQVEAPTLVRPPATLRFRVRVEDPDGVDNIARAEVAVPGSGTIPLSETDAAGNPTPCDGLYSAAFSIPRGFEAGFLTFRFRAYDRDGAASAEVPFTVEVRP